MLPAVSEFNYIRADIIEQFSRADSAETSLDGSAVLEDRKNMRLIPFSLPLILLLLVLIPPDIHASAKTSLFLASLNFIHSVTALYGSCPS